MGLARYRAKRDLARTPEPAGGKSTSKGRLIFVVHRHKASQLHYDLRLEMEGVLKSWAVPKGPSMDPADKRLAMMVEDHPYDYKDFKGVIPAGNYGAGIVEIWDRGTYAPIEAPDGNGEKSLLAQLRQGSFKIRMQGRKLKGEFALVRMKKAGDNGWLLIKHRDEHAVQGYDSEAHTPKASPINRALAKEGKRRPASTKGKRAAPRPKASAAAKAAAPAAVVADRPVARHAGTKGALVRDAVKPMLATLTEAPFDDPDWVFEIKWDGYRAIAETGGKALRLYSRNGRSFKAAYPAVEEDLERIKRKLVLDGEITALDEQGRPDFQRLQLAANDPGTALVYNVFDLLERDGEDLRNLPLSERKRLLRESLPASAHVRYSDHVDTRGLAFFEAAKEQHLEGIMAKRKEGRYLEGKRSTGWLKIKHHNEQEVVIGGWTAPRNSRQHFGALLLGTYENGKLVYVGHTGTGFTAASLQEMAERMKPLQRKTSPFAGPVDANAPATWVKPQLVAQVKFTEWTRDGHLRHPVFLGLRNDKATRDVHRERATRGSSTAMKKKKASPAKPPKKARSKQARPAAKADEQANDRSVKVGRHTVQLTNQQKAYWPDEGITKGDVIAYYDRIAPLILPYLKDRPQSLFRTPNGIKGSGFFQKDAGGDAPDWVATQRISSESRGEPINYILCNNKATLLYLANLGCIELNPWTSRKQHLLKPDHLVMDLDPSQGNTFDDVVEAALAVKAVLDHAGLQGYCKTSGASGMHVYIPVGARHSYEVLAPLAKDIMRAVHALLPGSTTLVRSLAKRPKHKIYLDHLQNRKGQTLASVYALRPRPGAPVSTPLAWEEVKSGLDPREFNLRSIHDRIARKGDLFAGVLKRPRFNLQRAKQQLAALLEAGT